MAILHASAGSNLMDDPRRKLGVPDRPPTGRMTPQKLPPSRKQLNLPPVVRPVSMPGHQVHGVQSRHAVAAPVRGVSALGVTIGPGQVHQNAHSGSPGVLPWRPLIDPSVKRVGVHERKPPWTQTEGTPYYARGASASFLAEKIVIDNPQVASKSSTAAPYLPGGGGGPPGGGGGGGGAGRLK